MHRALNPSIVQRTGMATLLLVILAAVAGCASTPEPPTTALANANDMIATAERADARQYAGAELDEAKQKIKQAESAVDAEQMVDAEQLAQQSQIAAELAIARTDAAKASRINRQLRQDAEALDEEMQRMGEQR